MSDFNEFDPRPEGEEFKQEVGRETGELVDGIKELVAKGNIAKIIIKKGEREFVNVPLNVGIVGSLIGVAAAPWAVIATAGFDCVVELVKEDGEIIDLSPRTFGKRLADTGAAVADSILGVVNGADDAPWDHAPEAEAPEAEAEAEAPEAEAPEAEAPEAEAPEAEAAPWDEPPQA